MKRNVLKLSVGLLSLVAFFSCLNDNEDIYVSYGVIQNVNSSNNYEILTDKGNILKVTKSHTIHSIENEKRVLVNFEIVSEKESSKKIYEVNVNGFYNLLSKPVVYESFILQSEEVRRDSIGNDPFTQIDFGFGGNYINIDFKVLHQNYSDIKHMINLVYDDTRADADTIYLTLYHNAYGEVPGKGLSLISGVGRSSFKISDLLPPGVTSKRVQLTWSEYFYDEVRVRSASSIFKLGKDSYVLNNNIDSSIKIR